MKRLKTPFILLTVLTSFLVSSCKKEPAADIYFPNSESKQLVGSWNWIGSSGGNAGNRINPATEGYSKQIEFSENGRYYEFQNGKNTLILDYGFEKGKSIFNSQLQYLIKYKSPADTDFAYGFHSYLFLGNDSLILREECADCYGHLYVHSK
tara:strand:+ start:84315 stop:84770 length:456 start_codon:yes stop_codon:yes gene_type:complete